jgi:hypothetical protein
MTQGVRIQVVLPAYVAKILKKQAQKEQRSLSGLAAYLLENASRPTTD